MSIYQVNQYGSRASVFFVPDQATADTAPQGNPLIASVKIGTQQDAQTFLQAYQAQIIEQEAARFSIAANFSDGNGNTVWRALNSNDPDNTVCQVFNTFTGGYTEYQTVTEAKAAEVVIQQQFLKNVRLDAPVEVSAFPAAPKQPTVSGATTL
jgi:hypothetical protein